MHRRNFQRSTLSASAVGALSGIMVGAFIAATPVHASTLVADGITYSLTATVINATTDHFTLGISGINGTSDTEKGRFGVKSFAFNTPTNFSSATPPSGFTFQAGGLNANGCDGSGGFFCFSANTTPAGPALTAGSTLSFAFDVILSSGTFAGYSPDFKIEWVGTNNHYDLVSLPLAPTITSTPLPGTLALFGGGLLGLTWLRRRRSASSKC
jgi:hypothetical protein